MSAIRFLELNSAYRDRNLYPLPSLFEVNIAQSGQKNKLEAVDPVSNASPVLTWNSTMLEGGTNIYSRTNLYIQDITISPVDVPSLTGNTTFLISTSTLTVELFRQVKNFYVGCYLIRGKNGNWPFANYEIVSKRIVEYQPLNYRNAIVRLESSMPDSMIGKDGFMIIAPTPIATETENAIIKFWIPPSNSGYEDVQRFQDYGFGSDNYYVNYKIINTDTQLSLKITAFDAASRLATLDGRTYNPRTGFTENWATKPYNFTIRKEDPIEFGYITYAVNNAIQIISEVTELNTIIKTDRYSGDFLRIRPYPNTIPPWIRPVNEERRICRYVYGQGFYDTIYDSPATAVTFDENARPEQNYYKNCILTTANIVGTNIIYGASTLIKYYGKSPDGSSDRYAELDPPIIILPAQIWVIRTVILCDPFTVTPSVNALYEVEQFTRDNAVPFVWTGSLITTSEEVCYEVELVNLVIPNNLLVSGRGGRAAFYPYLYVELSQVSSTSGPAGTRGILSSNNPNAFKMLFRAILSDTVAPEYSPYIKIDGDLMIHTIKFKPTDNFRFGVYHPNGEPLRQVIDEQYSPTEPNALIQTSAFFSFRKV